MLVRIDVLPQNGDKTTAVLIPFSRIVDCVAEDGSTVVTVASPRARYRVPMPLDDLSQSINHQLAMWYRTPAE